MARLTFSEAFLLCDYKHKDFDQNSEDLEELPAQTGCKAHFDRRLEDLPIRNPPSFISKSSDYSCMDYSQGSASMVAPQVLAVARSVGDTSLQKITHFKASKYCIVVSLWIHHQGNSLPTHLTELDTCWQSKGSFYLSSKHSSCSCSFDIY